MTDKDNYSLKEFIQTQFQAMDKKLDEFFSSHRDLEKTVVANKERITHINTKINTTIWAFSITIPVIIVLLTYIYTRELEQMRLDINNSIDKALLKNLSK